jgi:hypothetical protein
MSKPEEILDDGSPVVLQPRLPLPPMLLPPTEKCLGPTVLPTTLLSLL